MWVDQRGLLFLVKRERGEGREACQGLLCWPGCTMPKLRLEALYLVAEMDQINWAPITARRNWDQLLQNWIPFVAYFNHRQLEENLLEHFLVL